MTLSWQWYSITPWLIKIKFCRQWNRLEKEQSHVLITCKPVLTSKYVKTKSEVSFHLGIMWESLLSTACLLYFKQRPWIQSLLSNTLPMFAKCWQPNPSTPKPLPVQVPESTPCTERFCERHCWALTLIVNVHTCIKHSSSIFNLF